MAVNEAHLAQMKQIVQNMSAEETAVIVKEIPLDVLAKEVWNRVSELCEFKASFDELVEKSNHIEKNAFDFFYKLGERKDNE